MSGSATNMFFLRHGIFSKSDNMVILNLGLKGILPGWRSYYDDPHDWKAPVLQSGIVLAGDVLERITNLPPSDIGRTLLIGHSQGGLVARVAAATITDPEALDRAIEPANSRDRPYLKEARELLRDLCDRYDEGCFARARASVVGVVTLATPNSGAFTMGQLSILTRLVSAAVEKTFGFKWKDIPDLRTDRLFRILQRVKVPRVRYLSVSGSAVNKYSLVTHADLGEFSPLKRLAPHLDLPNDIVVEDSSVDLRQAPLPCEVADLPSQYKHIRVYADCTDVTHSGIHEAEVVLEELRSVFDEWGLYT